MSVAFEAAWMLLKNVRGGPTGRRMPMTEEESYGNVSFRESPLHGLEDDDEDMDRYEEEQTMPSMTRIMGGRPPANLGRAGSTDEMPMGEPPNPFPNKPLAGRMQDQLAEFADGAGRRAAMSPQTDYSDAQEDDDMDASLAPFVGETPKGLGDPHPEAHSIASTNLRQTPRKQKRGMMDSGQAFKRPGFRGPAMPLPGGKEDGDFQNMPPQARGSVGDGRRR